MKEVEWWTAKVYPKGQLEDGKRIDLWGQHKSRGDAEQAVQNDFARDGFTPFCVVRNTLEVFPTKLKLKKKCSK